MMLLDDEEEFEARLDNDILERFVQKESFAFEEVK
jgi:hypothetical protein